MSDDRKVVNAGDAFDAENGEPLTEKTQKDVLADLESRFDSLSEGTMILMPPSDDNIPLRPSCGHMGAVEYDRVYTIHGRKVRTAACHPCHNEITEQFAVIESITESNVAGYAFKVAGASGAIQLGAAATLHILHAIADHSDLLKEGKVADWMDWLRHNFERAGVHFLS